MTSLTAYYATLGAMITACGLFGGMIGLTCMFNNTKAALTGLIVGLLTGVVLAMAPAYMKAGGEDYETIMAMRDRDCRMSAEVAYSLTDGMISRYEYERLVRVEDDLENEDRRNAALTVPVARCGRRSADPSSGVRINIEIDTTTDTETRT